MLLDAAVAFLAVWAVCSFGRWVEWHPVNLDMPRPWQLAAGCSVLLLIALQWQYLRTGEARSMSGELWQEARRALRMWGGFLRRTH